MPQWDEDDARADILLQQWGHNPKTVRKLAALHRGLHWDRLLMKARHWGNTVDVLETAMNQLLAYRDGKWPTDDEVDETIQRIGERMAVLKRPRRS